MGRGAFCSAPPQLPVARVEKPRTQLLKLHILCQDKIEIALGNHFGHQVVMFNCREPRRSFSECSTFRFRVWLLALAALAVTGASVPGKDKVDSARDLKDQLVQKVMPYWYDTAVDRQYGGYILSDDAVKKLPPATEKQLVTQSRMIWGFSHAHLKGLSDGKRDYLKAAQQGYQFLIDHFLDREKGGYFWTTDITGKPLDQRKIVYGESFVIYGFVEYYRASGDKDALQRAMDLYQVLQKRSHDSVHGGWIEHFQRDWTPILEPNAQVIVERAGCKSANTHLHLLESLTELYAATQDSAVRTSLQEAVTLNCTWFYPRDPGKSAFHRHLDWTPVTEPSSAGLSYGHNVEFAWLMIRGQQVLEQAPAWDHFDAHIQHALKYGYDHTRGGLYSRGVDDQPATDTDKVWWVQAEMLAALTDGLKHRANADYSTALDQLLSFILTYQVNPSDDIWYDTVTAEGKPKVTGKAHNWKANYHDVRAMVKYIEAFGK
jgi:cellobiose epimerase